MVKKSPPTIGRFNLTARTDAPDFRDYVYEPALLNLKPRIDPPDDVRIRDQGRSNACTGFGLAAVIDRLMVDSGHVANGQPVRASSLMLYEMALRYDEWPEEKDAGSSCRGAIKGWYNMGICREELYPFDPRSRRDYSIEAAKDARNNTIGAYYRLGTRISDYHAALNEVGAIFCSAAVHTGWAKPDPASGRITPGRRAEGGHAFAIIGYDDRGFWIQNSWGDGWGRRGVALWTYEDWLASVQDAWVFRMGLPTPQIWHLPSRGGRNITAMEQAHKPARAEIAAMKETFKDNRIYPYHIMYDTGILEELKDVLIGRRQEADARAAGMTDWIDRLVEKLARVPGRALWREMKAGAELPFAAGRAGTATLQAFSDAFSASGKAIKFHLVGHSTGMILLSYLLRRLSGITPQTPSAPLA